MKPAQDYTNTFVRPKFTGETELGAPSPECTAPKPEGAGLSHTSTPIEFFSTFLDDLWVKQMRFCFVSDRLTQAVLRPNDHVSFWDARMILASHMRPHNNNIWHHDCM